MNFVSCAHHVQQWMPGKQNCCSGKQGVLWLKRVTQLCVVSCSMGCIWRYQDIMPMFLFSKLTVLTQWVLSSDSGSLLRLVHLHACPRSSSIALSSTYCQWAESSVAWLSCTLPSITVKASLRFWLWFSAAAQAVAGRALMLGAP